MLKAMDGKDFGTIKVARFVSRTLETELENNTNSVIPFFGVTIAIMLFFSISTVMMGDWVRTKPWLGLMGVVSAVLACVAAFGFLIYLGVEFIGINMAAPFLMLGECWLCVERRGWPFNCPCFVVVFPFFYRFSFVYDLHLRLYPTLDQTGPQIES